MITNFYQTAVYNDFARVFQFRLDSLKIGNIDWTYDSSGELVYVETANLPGRTINNIPVPFMGVSFNVPGNTSFPGSNNYPLTIRCDQQYALRAELEDELVRLFSISTTTGNYSTPNDTQQLTMTLFGKSQDANGPTAVRQYTLVGLYLVSLQDTQYDVKDTGNVALINPVFAYQYWTVASAAPGTSPDADNMAAIGAWKTAKNSETNIVGPAIAGA